MRFILRSLATLILVYASVSTANAQQLGANENTFFFPHTYRYHQMISSLGLSTAKLPEDVVETDDLIRAPLFSYRVKYGLPENFVAEGGIETNIVTYQFSLGPKWNYQIDRMGFSVGADIAFWIGQLKHFGFDTKVNGWTLYPNISVGYQFDKFAISLKSEVVLNLAETSTQGDLEISDNLDFYNGWTIGVYLEQPLWKDNFLVLGIRSTFLKYYYPLWAAFSTFDRTYYIPEATITFIL